MNKKRPINNDLTSLKFPAMAIISILHRLSGLLLFLLMPLMLYFLALSLDNIQSFVELQSMMENPLIKLSLWAFASALVFHILSGIRHLLMDLGLGEALESGRRSAFVFMGIASVFIVLLGVWIW